MGNSGRQYEAIKFTYGSTDLQEMGAKLARENQNVYDLEARKKEIDADLASQIKAANGRVSDITTRLNNGYEMREVEVMVLYDTPRAGLKRVLRIDTNEALREEAMTLAEMQRGFAFDSTDS